MDIQARTGIFFLLIGILAMVIFVRYMQVGEGGVEFFLIGVVSIGIGWLMWNRWRTKPNNQYFRLLRKKSSKREDREE